MEKKEWYAVRTFPGYEVKVIDKLVKQIQNEKKEEVIGEIFLPIRKKYVFVRGKLKLKEEMMFPGYIFVNMIFNNDTFYFVRGIQYVTGYAGISSMKQIPKPMKDSEYETMVDEVKKIQIDLEEGANVVVVNHDLYENSHAVVRDIDCERTTITVELKGHEKLITLNFDQISLN